MEEILLDTDGYLLMSNGGNNEEVDEFLLAMRHTLNINDDKNGMQLIIGKKGKGYMLSLLSEDRIIQNSMVLPFPQTNLKLEDFIELNERAEKMILKEEWLYGLTDRAGLEQVIGTVNQVVFNYELHPTITDKAAYLWYAIATKQLFNNGNKRTAFLSALSFLRINFYNLDMLAPKKLYDITLDVANKKISEHQLKVFILEHIYVDYKTLEDILEDN